MLGISVDSFYSHAAYARELGIAYPLLSDWNRTVTPEYVGYYDDVDGLARVGRRAVVIVAPDGRVAWRWDAPEIVDLPDQEEILAALERLKGAR